MSSAGLQGLVDGWCRSTGRPLFGPRPEHVCTRECVVLGVWPHQVCAHSRLEHHCGGARGCSHLVESSEGPVCGFSGRVLGGPRDSVPSFGDNHWGPSRRRASVPNVRRTDFRGEVDDAVRYFLCSSGRRRVWSEERERLLQACVRSGRSFRPCSGSHPCTRFRAAAAICQRHLSDRRASLSTPARPLPWLSTLGGVILEWWRAVSLQCPGLPDPCTSQASLFAPVRGSPRHSKMTPPSVCLLPGAFSLSPARGAFSLPRGRAPPPPVVPCVLTAPPLPNGFDRFFLLLGQF